MGKPARPPPDLDGLNQGGAGGRPPAGRSSPLRAVFWNARQQRARAVWLILLPVVGAYVALIASEVVATAAGLPVQVGFALWSFAALAAALALVRFSHRYLGARSLRDYGLVIDRRWRLDLAAGLVIGLVAAAAPILLVLAMGWAEIGAVFDAGELELLPGFAAVAFGVLCVGIWEEIAMRGVFLSNAADGFRAWLSPRRAVAAAVALSGFVFGLAHIANPDYAPLILTWVLAGLVLGGIYVLTGNLALPIGAHITINAVYQMGLVRTDTAGTEHFSAVMRVTPDPTLAFLQLGGVIDIGLWVTLGLLTYLWLRISRGKVSVDLAALKLDTPPQPRQPDATVVST